MQTKCSDTAATTVHSRLTTIKQELRACMNGVASAAMKRSDDYRVNFGVELPRLKTLADSYGHDPELALALWQEPVRECRIMATMMYPVDKMDSEMADVWMSNIHTAELAQAASINLFRHMADAARTALRWMASDDETTILCGLCTAYHLLRDGKLDKRQTEELQDQAATLNVAANNIAIRRVANNIGLLKG